MTVNHSSAAVARCVIGVHDGHNASVALLRDGHLELALQEERFTRVKNQGDAPAQAGRIHRWRNNTELNLHGALSITLGQCVQSN